jgi:hypothetical protein
MERGRNGICTACTFCGAPLEGDLYAKSIECPFCRRVTPRLAPIGRKEVIGDPEDLFTRRLYVDCKKVSGEICNSDPNNVKAKLFLGLSELFEDPDDHFSIDRNLYFLLVDRTTTPLGSIAAAFRNIRSATSASDDLRECLFRHIKEYYRTRVTPTYYSSSFGNKVLSEIESRS